MALTTYAVKMQTKGRGEITVMQEARNDLHAKELLRMQYGNDVKFYGHKVVK